MPTNCPTGGGSSRQELALSSEERDMTTSPVERGTGAAALAPEGAGREWIVDASGCARDRLTSLSSVRAVCEQVIRELELQIVGQPLWRQFPEPGGVTGLYLLSESHLACHTWPEMGLATFNLFSCRRRPDWSWDERLREMLGATAVSVRVAERGVPQATIDDARVIRAEGATA
jgi:S-adenosylmethionine decarboxylase